MYPSRDVTFISVLMTSFVLYVDRSIGYKIAREKSSSSVALLQNVSMCIFISMH